MKRGYHIYLSIGSARAKLIGSVNTRADAVGAAEILLNEHREIGTTVVAYITIHGLKIWEREA